ncbi:hypothetical protein [Novosphingobium sp.]|uniref:hypothetical protein n=1 Tax=Novosphingobium sp. TaxID=1874826 RepID=UPI003B52469C
MTGLWATHGSTESGDSLPVILWSSIPDETTVHKVYEVLLPEEYGQGCSVRFERSPVEDHAGVTLAFKAQDTLARLEAAGVDNWEGYHLAFQDEDEGD